MRYLLALAAVAGVLGTAATTSEAPRPHLSVLFLGNSLTAANDLPRIVAALGAKAGTDVEYETVAPGGVNLEDHWRLTGGRDAVARGHWDVVVLQQGPSALAESQVDLRTWATTFGEAIRHSGARPALYAVWPESYRTYAFPAVAASYRKAATAAHAELYPAGTAWQNAWRRNPRLRLYGPDGFHPSALGSYLAAAVIYGGLTNRLPVRLPTSLDAGDVRIRISTATARTLRAAAAEALR
jgi:hypothetical protein